MSPSNPIARLKNPVLASLLGGTLSIVAHAPLAAALKAGPARAHEAIIGGSAAARGTFGSLAFIVDFRGRLAAQCTGTVVAPNLVLTAGHCVEDVRTGVVENPSGYRVVTGSVDWASGEGQVSKVQGLLVYDGYIRRVDEGDAALLVLSTPTTAPAITLAPASTINRLQAGSRATIAGWGRTRYAQTRPTQRLQWAETVLQGRAWCGRAAPPFFATGELCAITPPRYTTGACEGDSGGPLIASGPAGEPLQIGIAIHVYGRCSTRRPSVFTRVDRISQWLQSWIEAYRRPPPPPAT